jgi:hypothetical protein
MAVGIQQTQAGLNQQAGQLLLSLRQDMFQVQAYNAYIQQLGSAGLQAMGFTAEDATMLLTTFAAVDSIRAMAMGSPYVGPTLPFNFLAAAVPFTGGN